MSEGETELTDGFLVDDFIDEITRFTANNSHKHDDQVDVLNDAIADLLIEDNANSYLIMSQLYRNA